MTERLHGLPGAPQDEAGLTRKFETSHVGGATGRTPPIPRSALEKDPRPGHLFEGNPVDEGTTRRATDIPMHRLEKHADSWDQDLSPCSLALETSPPSCLFSGAFLEGGCAAHTGLVAPRHVGSSRPRDRTWVSCIAGRFFTNGAISSETGSM